MGLSSRCPPTELATIEEHLVHVIAVMHLIKEKGTAAKVKEAFAALVAVRKEMSPFFNFPDNKTAAKKEVQKKKLNKFKEIFKAKEDFTITEAQKAYKLFRCFVVGKAQTQWDRIINKMHTKNPWIGVNGKTNTGLHVRSWISFMYCIKLHKLTVFPADATEKQRYYVQHAEILGDPYSKKSPLPSIGNFPRLANSPKLLSYQALGQSRIQQRHTTRYNHPRIEAQLKHIILEKVY
jgi:hypothetical protein